MGAGGKVISGITGLGGSVLTADAQKNASMTREEQDRDQAAWARRQAGDALLRGAIASGRIKMRGGEIAASQAANFAASGVDANVGTAAEVQANTRAMAALDALTIRNNAAREAFGFEHNARTLSQQAGIEHDNGNMQQEATILGGIGGAADAGGQAGDAYFSSQDRRRQGGL